MSAHAEEGYFETLPVVLSVSRLPQAMEDTPGAVTVIDSELIAATGYRDLARLFRLVPGMQVGQERANHHWVTYHGLGSDYPNQMQVLVDGRSVYSPYFFGGADWGSLPIALEDIDRIEVVRGSDSAAYGSNAFLGVVNILTRHTGAETGNSVSLRGGTNGIADATGRAVLHDGAMGLRVTAQHIEDRGMADLHDSQRIDVLNLRADLRVSAVDEVTVTAGMSSGARSAGYEGTQFDVVAPRTARHEDGAVHLKWRRTLSPDDEWSLSWYRNREQSREDWLLDSHKNLRPEVAYLRNLPRLVVTVDNDRDSLRDNIEFSQRLRPLDDLRLLWGTEWRRDWLRAPMLFYGGDSHSQQEWRLFGNAEWRMAPRWLWNIGAMAEQIEGDRLRLAPRVFLNWQPSPTQTWRAGYSRAWRQPTLFERSADIRVVHPQLGLIMLDHLPNPDIRPQRIDAWEVGFLGQLPQQGSFDLRLFHERIEDFIVRRAVDPAELPDNDIQRAAGATRWVNSGDGVRLVGLEYQLRTRPWSGGQLVLSHSLIRAHSDDDAVRRSVAPYTASLTWLQRYGPWQSTLSLLRMGASDSGSGYVPGYRYKVPAYTTLDWSIARTLQVGPNPVELRLTGINLLGKHQELVLRPLQSMPGYGDDRPANELDRQLHLSVRVGF
ncbi:TonB-dependent receptor plug domain-containing protein [Azoarcus olearius]|uniref:TonB-dependent receptor n=1 Tax=Azoarcus sp. (strain BH72) TaxID=418699 RepID=A1K1K6_AZOSB|nr:TonB-dependent receptor [Azoarcus olearius]ANQ83186.1 putative TonB-dependent receptor [Azoarcus olearius]CAL92711.1 putative TonB-dependent receptor [Azoarcus olearius]